MAGPILVLGAGGQVGREILNEARRCGIKTIGLPRSVVDITSPVAVQKALAEVAPRLIINAAGYTAVDRAETEAEGAAAANEFGAEVVARAAAAVNTALVHLSTDFVFDGLKNGAYVESDPVAPLNVYGRTKANGEERVRQSLESHVIVRTSWVYGTYGSNFLKTIVKLSRDREELTVVSDQYGCPTSTKDIAQAMFAIDHSVQQAKSRWGTYHFTGKGVTNWQSFASAIVEAQAVYTHRRPLVRAIRTEDWPALARRPANSELASGLFGSVFGYAAGPWQDRVKEAVCDIFSV